MTASFLSRGLMFLLLLALAGLQLRYAFEEQLVFSESTERLADEAIRNPFVLTHFAKQRHLFEADLDGAARLLRQALTYSPLYVPAWLSLAELLNDQGEKTKAAVVVDYADNLTRSIKRWRWEKTLTAYQLGLTHLLPGELRYIIAAIPGKSRNDALTLAFTLWSDPGQLEKRVGADNLPHLFNHAVRTNKAGEALVFWGRLAELEFKLNDKEKLAFIDMLMRNNRIAEAVPVWRTTFNDTDTIYNQSFTALPLGRAFGWRFIDTNDFEHRFEPLLQSGTHAVNLRFKGWENLNFHHILQIVPLDPGARYRFSVWMKSAKLTTDQRPYWEVYGYKCEASRASTDMVAAEQDWSESTLEFTVPPGCAAIVVRLRRNESNMLDNKIAGRLWFKEPRITRIDEATTTGWQ